jgi:hypothetical protein
MGATERGAALHGEMLGQASSTLHQRRNPRSTCRTQFERRKNVQEVNAMPNLRPGTIVPTPEEDAEITAAAMDDPDARPLSDNEWELVKPISSGDVPGDSGQS